MELIGIFDIKIWQLLLRFSKDILLLPKWKIFLEKYTLSHRIHF
jgi:hypothetical protein